MNAVKVTVLLGLLGVAVFTTGLLISEIRKEIECAMSEG